MRKLGLYVHIPFCVIKCRYCDFLSAPAAPETRAAYLDSLIRQISAWGRALQDGPAYEADSIYIGGGTPSVLTPEQMSRLTETLSGAFRLAADTEITAECNPGTADQKKLEAWRGAGINRLSLGLQSSDNEELKLLGRIHTWETFLESYRAARAAGFDNINIDVMGALPGQSVRSYTNTLERVLALQPEHISAYSLIIEEGTPFFACYGDGHGLPSEDETVEMDEITWRLLGEHGYQHYEISNYAQPKRACRHNLKYWQCGEYLGFGTGAASFIRKDCGLMALKELRVKLPAGEKLAEHVRLKLLTDTQAFISRSWDDIRAEDFEEMQLLTVREEMEEMAFLGLRTGEGVSLEEFERRFHVPFERAYAGPVKQYCDMGMMRIDGKHAALTLRGMEVANWIMADFICSGQPQ